ncbi:hypothetical protein DL770_008334 [Monosporascus sp. CRB-9-2]|nr:hypothetical protein DL770_008334 [Monosporascus sp. CRB-9-2]
MGWSLFNLPPEIRNQIYDELLVVSQPLYLSPTPLWDTRAVCLYGSHDPTCTPGLRLWPAILRVSRAVHREAAWRLYAANCFSLQRTNPYFDMVFPFDVGDFFASFLGVIGPRNAGYLRRVRIPFPRLGSPNPPPPAIGGVEREFSLEQQSRLLLETFAARCPELRVLQVSAAMGCFPEGGSPDAASKALSVVGAQVGAIKSLRSVIVEFYGALSSPHLRHLMAAYGWTVQLVQ